MDDLPPDLLPALFSVMLDSRMPVYLLVHPDGYLAQWGGPLSFYGIESPQSGLAIDQSLVFLQGMFPLGKTETLSLPCVETQAGIFAEVYIVPAAVGHWVVLLDVTQETYVRQRLQQKANEANLFRVQQTKGIQQMLEETAADPLLTPLVAPFSGGRYRDVTILCLALRGLSSLEEQPPAEELLSMFNLSLRTLVQPIREEAGLVLKVVEAQLIAIFGLLPTLVAAPCATVQAALRMIAAITTVRTRIAKELRPTLNVGIGITSGRVLMGMIGEEKARALNVLGTCVQRAINLVQFAHADQILVDKDVVSHCEDVRVRFTEVCVPLYEGKASISVFACGAA